MRLLHRETVVVLLVMLVPIACIGCNRAVSEVLPDEPDSQATADQKVEEQGAAGEASEVEAPGDRPATNPEPAAAAEPAVVPEVPQNDAAEKNASAAESPGDAVAPVPLRLRKARKQNFRVARTNRWMLPTGSCSKRMVSMWIPSKCSGRLLRAIDRNLTVLVTEWFFVRPGNLTQEK